MCLGLAFGGTRGFEGMGCMLSHKLCLGAQKCYNASGWNRKALHPELSTYNTLSCILSVAQIVTLYSNITQTLNPSGQKSVFKVTEA